MQQCSELRLLIDDPTDSFSRNQDQPVGQDPTEVCSEG